MRMTTSLSGARPASAISVRCEETGTARRDEPCTNMPAPQRENGRTVGSRHESKCPSGLLPQTNPGFPISF